VPDEAYDAARKRFSAQELAFLSVSIATINAWNRLGAAFRFAPPIPKKVAAAA
jgi:alkylhydroperoxidase family enzyme